ncbi:MAG: hypothetical protein AAGD25_36410, partial [Cyanobacteria bacterium P01_F01_bin.150]
MPTFQTKLPIALSEFLNAQDELYGRIELDIFVHVNSGQPFSSLEKTLQAKHGVDSTTVRNCWHNVKGKIDAVKALHDETIAQLKRSIAALKQSIAAKEKKLTKLRVTKEPSWEIRRAIHGKKRKLATLESKLEKAIAQKQDGRVSIAFGSKKLFNAQHHLEANGYANHDEWLADWRDARSGNFLMVGNKIYSGGNQLCKLTPAGALTINVPFPLLDKFGSKITAQCVNFAYGQEWVDAALVPVRRFSKAAKKQSSRIGTEKPVTHRFVRKGGVWYLHTHVELPEIPTITSKHNGAIGVDLNADSIDWAFCDQQGNLKYHGHIPLVTDGMTSHQATDAMSKAIGEIITVASAFECPIVIEKLDFRAKKATLGER